MHSALAASRAKYEAMTWWRKWMLDCRNGRCWPWNPLTLRKVIDPSGCYYTLPKYAVGRPDQAAWVQLDTAEARAKLSGHWLEHVPWLPIMFTGGSRKEPATRAEVARYLEVTATIAGRRWGQ